MSDDQPGHDAMNENSENSRRWGRFQRYGVIGVAVVLFAVALAALWWRAGAPGRDIAGGLPATVVAQHAIARMNTEAKPAGTPGKSGVPANHTGERSWTALFEKLAAILTGKKIEVCGLSDLEAALFLAGDSEAGTGAADSVLSQATSNLLLSSKPDERTLGIYAQAQLPFWAAINASGRESRICDGNFDCILETMKKDQSTSTIPTANPAAATLVKLALLSRDPNIIAAAIYACRGMRAEPCESISLADWAAVDADNAVVWLKLAEEAASKKDIAARDAALRRAAGAGTYDPRSPSLAPLLDSALVRAQAPLVQSSVTNAIGNSWINATIPSLSGVTSYCFHDKNIDASRNALCDAIANKLLDKDDSVVGLSTVISLGKRLGWDEARLEALRDEKATVLGPMLETMSEEKAFSCKALEKNNQWVREAMSKGERTLARDRIEKSGQSFSETAQHYRKKYPDSFK